MIVVKIELHSARTGKVTTLGQMNISNTGLNSTEKSADYNVEILRKGTTDKVQRRGLVRDYPRQAYTVWELVRRALEAGLSKWPIHPGHPEEFDENVREEVEKTSRKGCGRHAGWKSDCDDCRQGFYFSKEIEPGYISPEFQAKLDTLRGK